MEVTDIEEIKQVEDVVEAKVLKGDEAYALYKQGKEKWNAWAKEHEGWVVDFTGRTFHEEVDFSGYVFPGDAKFQKTNFSRNANFFQVIFSGSARFDLAVFFKDSNFTFVKFSDRAIFHDVTFSGRANFIRITALKTAFFLNSKFSKISDFRNSMFSGGVTFYGAIFSGNARFYEVTFSGPGTANFRGASFHSTCSFNNARFLQRIVFYGSSFKDVLAFNGASFKYVPDLQCTSLNKSVSVSGITVDYLQAGKWWEFGKAYGHEDADKYRRLKELAVATKDHQSEKMFFTYELRAKRFYQTKGLKLIPNFLYDWLSDYGQSIVRPLGFLIVTWLAFALSFVRMSNLEHNFTAVKKSLLMSFSQLVPFFGAARSTRSEASKILFGEAGLPDMVSSLCLAENFLGILFVFLIGLALRGRFKV